MLCSPRVQQPPSGGPPALAVSNVPSGCHRERGGLRGPGHTCVFREPADTSVAQPENPLPICLVKSFSLSPGPSISWDSSGLGFTVTNLETATSGILLQSFLKCDNSFLGKNLNVSTKSATAYSSERLRSTRVEGEPRPGQWTSHWWLVSSLSRAQVRLRRVKELSRLTEIQEHTLYFWSRVWQKEHLQKIMFWNSGLSDRSRYRETIDKCRGFLWSHYGH